MILKETFDLRKVAGYIWQDMALSAVSAATAYTVCTGLGVNEAALPFAPVGVLGSALAIFLAFRNNTSYARWTEGALCWQTITTQSRIFGRLIMTFVDAHQHTPQYNPERAQQFQEQMIHRQIAWVNALRLQLRGQEAWDSLQAHLSDDDYAALSVRQNKPAFLMQRHGQQIYQAMANGTLQGFDSFQLEGAMAQLAAQQSACERLKAIPVPRQYTYFTRLFVQLFVVLLPFCLISLFVPTNTTWLIFPLTLLISFLFVTVERVGAVNEYPFENRLTDVPLLAFCNGIERDLLETLGDPHLPPRLQPQAGYLD